MKATVFSKTMTIGIITCFFISCSIKPPATSTEEEGSLGPKGGEIAAAQFSIKIYDGSATLYSEGNLSSSIELTSEQSYILELSEESAPKDVTYALDLQNTSVVGATKQSMDLARGKNNLVVSQAGDYIFTVRANAEGMNEVSHAYKAEVTCSKPTFTADSLSPSMMTIQLASSNNLFNLSAASVVSSANGLSPYSCAWDPTGTGIIDTAFVDCSKVFSNFYSNFVGSRKVGLVVKDACNTTYTVKSDENFQYTKPSIGNGNTFIFGETSDAIGVAQGDSRVDSVEYLATNQANNWIVSPWYSQGAGTFNIKSVKNYKMGNSVDFGMNISLSGIKNDIKRTKDGATGSVDMSSAKVSKVVFTTDQVGDSKTRAEYNSTNCTLSNQGAKILAIKNPAPCSGGKPRENQTVTVEIWGHYVCEKLATTGGSVRIEGDFDGASDIADSCAGTVVVGGDEPEGV